MMMDDFDRLIAKLPAEEQQAIATRVKELSTAHRHREAQLTNDLSVAEIEAIKAAEIMVDEDAF